MGNDGGFFIPSPHPYNIQKVFITGTVSAADGTSHGINDALFPGFNNLAAKIPIACIQYMIRKLIDVHCHGILFLSI